MFSINSEINRFAILLCCSDDARASRIVAYLIEQGAPVINWTILSEEKKFWAKKLQKKWVFGVFTHYCTKSLCDFTVLL